jgi:hypothetical protein
LQLSTLILPNMHAYIHTYMHMFMVDVLGQSDLPEYLSFGTCYFLPTMKLTL